MANIYEIGSSFDLIWSLIETEDFEEEALIDAFDNLVEDAKVKLESCCKYIKNVDADIEGLDAEIKRLQAKKKSLTNGKERLKALMLRVLQKMGEKKLSCGTFTVSRQNNPSTVVMDEQSIKNIPARYLKIAEPTIDKALIKKDLDAGVDLEGLAHLEQNEGLRIR